MPTPGRPPRPAGTEDAEPADLRRRPGPAPSRMSAQIRYRQTANSQVGTPHTLQTADGVTSQAR